MILDELLWKINENTNVKLFSSETHEEIARYDGKDSFPDSYNYCDVTDIFVDEDGWLCIEIDTTDVEEEEEER